MDSPRSRDEVLARLAVKFNCSSDYPELKHRHTVNPQYRGGGVPQGSLHVGGISGATLKLRAFYVGGPSELAPLFTCTLEAIETGSRLQGTLDYTQQTRFLAAFGALVVQGPLIVGLSIATTKSWSDGLLVFGAGSLLIALLYWGVAESSAEPLLEALHDVLLSDKPIERLDTNAYWLASSAQRVTWRPR